MSNRICVAITLTLFLLVLGNLFVLGQGGTGREPPPSRKGTPAKTTPSKKTTRPNTRSSNRNAKPSPEPLTAQARANQARAYLINERGIDSLRIVTIDGGYREAAEMELWIVPSGAVPPVATPTTTPTLDLQEMSKITSRFHHALYFPVAQQPPDELRRRVCPTSLYVDCPSGLIKEGTPVTFAANVSGGPGTQTYNWSVSAGFITSGQGTNSISVDTAGLGGQTITATVELGGLNPSCNRTASCTAAVAAAPVPRKFDEFGDITFEDEKARLDNFAVQLQNEPTARGYIIAYSRRR